MKDPREWQGSGGVADRERIDMTQGSNHDADAAHLVELYDEKWRINHENAQRPSAGPDRLVGAHIDAALETARRQDEACEAFRRRYYPRRGQVIVGLRRVVTLSKTGRAAKTVFDPEVAR